MAWCVIREVRVFGSADVYISSETQKPSADLVNGYLLFGSAAVCLASALLLRPPLLRRLFVVAAAGMAYLALDEQFAIHESVGHNLWFLADLPGVKRPDDVILASYAIPAALFVAVFYPLLRLSRRAVVVMLTSYSLFADSSLWDVADYRRRSCS